MLGDEVQKSAGSIASFCHDGHMSVSPFCIEGRRMGWMLMGWGKFKRREQIPGARFTCGGTWPDSGH